MAWTTPLTAAANASLTAVQWNASVRDNLLATGPGQATATGRILVTTGANAIAERDVATAWVVGTTENTTSTTYADLATVGPAVTLTTGAKALITVGCYMSNALAGGRPWMSHEISGASTAAANDSWALMSTSSGGGELYGASQVTLWTTLTGGSNTFTAKYKVGSSTGSFSQRRIVVMGL